MVEHQCGFALLNLQAMISETDQYLLQQVVILTPTTLEVYDVHVSKLIERVQFDGLSLLSPSLNLTTNGALPYLDSVWDISHSMRVYKGKIFLLVSLVFHSVARCSRKLYRRAAKI